MSAQLITAIAIALLRGATLLSRNYSAGPHRDADDARRVLRFACCNLRGEPFPSSEEWEEAYLAGTEVDYLDAARDDWTAFGAARAFVALAGRLRAADALKELEEGATARLTGKAVPACT